LGVAENFIKSGGGSSILRSLMWLPHVKEGQPYGNQSLFAARLSSD